MFIGLVGVHGCFLSAAWKAWSHDCTSALHRHWKLIPNPSASMADSTVVQRIGSATPQ